MKELTFLQIALLVQQLLEQKRIENGHEEDGGDAPLLDAKAYKAQMANK